MSYLDKVLQPGETVLHRARLSWTIYLPGLLLLIIAIGAYVVSTALAPRQIVWQLIVLAIIGIPALIMLLRAWFDRWITEFAVTNFRIIYKRGFIRRHTIEMNMDKVESVDVDQSLLGRLLNYGDVTVRGVGTGLEPIHSVSDPLTFRSRVNTR
jgi:uncharacterized membrane protein YdbT with pleckstrin-like domain